MLAQIGRFEVRRLLGKGAQSAVYLGFDPHLEREVAIKTLHFDDPNPAQHQWLLREARTVSKLRHANVVPIFEAGEQDGDPYLVFEFVDGGTLADLIRAQAPLAPLRAAELMAQVLEAVAHAHGEGIIHRDLKPSNILITAQGVPRVMDFGIATRSNAAEAETNRVVGTPAYMSPEYVAQREVSAQSDIFAAGLILFELLTGRRAVPGDGVMATMQRIAAGDFGLAHVGEGEIEPGLHAIVARATALDPQLRYETAGRMSEALRQYLEPKVDPSTEAEAKGGKGVLEFLLRRMRHKGDFPAVSEAIRAINRLIASDRENLNSLSNSILKDFALTNKILRIVNSAYYRQAGAGSISTVSRAIVVLGFNAIRNVAISLILFEHLQNQGQATLLKEEFVRANLSGALARSLTRMARARDAEECFICAMFHDLGRLLTQYYFAEEAEQIRSLVASRNLDEGTASARVLGMSFQDLGMEVGRVWGFPEGIVHSMRRLPAGPVGRADSPDERLRVVASFASAACAIVENAPAEERAKQLAQLKTRFGAALPVSDQAMQEAIGQAMRETADFCSVVRLNMAQSPFGKQILREINAEEARREALTLAGAGAETADDSLLGTVLETGEEGAQHRKPAAPAQAALDPTVLATAEDLPQPPAPAPARDAADAQAILASGIQDISNSLVEDFSLNDLLRIILETMYRAMGFERIVLCVRDPKANAMQARFGFGPEIDEFIKRFRFPLGDAKSIFNVVLARGVDVLISDASDATIAQRVPDWYRKASTAQTFIVFPLVMKNVPVAMIYADAPRAGDIVISDKELSLLRTLRNQAVLAIKQSS
jgi:serine/threonine protein kinase